jgi:hypothetical protein
MGTVVSTTNASGWASIRASPWQHSGDDAPFRAGRGSSPRSTGRLPASARKETPPQKPSRPPASSPCGGEGCPLRRD